MSVDRENVVDLLSNSGTDRITPLPVPIHRRFDATSRQLIRTKEKPRLPVPEQPVHTKSYMLLHLACYVQLPAIPLSCNDSGQAVHTHVTVTKQYKLVSDVLQIGR